MLQAKRGRMEIKMEKIGFIGGGNMAEGIIRGLLQAGTKTGDQILVREIIPDRAAYLKERYGIVPVEDEQALFENARIIVLAVRPQDAPAVLRETGHFLNAGRHYLVSICAGIRIEALQKWAGKKIPTARIMPNTMVDVRRGYSALTFSEGFSSEQKDAVQAITDAIGKTMPLKEDLFDAFTAAGCAGPEWLILFAEALVDGAVESGISRKDAQLIVYENLAATGAMLLETGRHPGQITDEMNTPGGIGIAGFHVFQSRGIHGAAMDTVIAAWKRTTELNSEKEN